MIQEQNKYRQVIDLVACNLIDPWQQSAPLANWHGDQFITFAHSRKVASVSGIVTPGHVAYEGLAFHYQLPEDACLPVGLWPFYEEPPKTTGVFDGMVISDEHPERLVLLHGSEQIAHKLSPRAERTVAHLARINFVDKLIRHSEAVLSSPRSH